MCYLFILVALVAPPQPDIPMSSTGWIWMWLSADISSPIQWGIQQTSQVSHVRTYQRHMVQKLCTITEIITQLHKPVNDTRMKHIESVCEDMFVRFASQHISVWTTVWFILQWPKDNSVVPWRMCHNGRLTTCSKISLHEGHWFYHWLPHFHATLANQVDRDGKTKNIPNSISQYIILAYCWLFFLRCVFLIFYFNHNCNKEERSLGFDISSVRASESSARVVLTIKHSDNSDRVTLFDQLNYH